MHVWDFLFIKYFINFVGICEDLVNNEDLESVENLSAREKNVRKRQKRKLAKERDESSKKQKIAALNISGNKIQKVANWLMEL